MMHFAHLQFQLRPVLRTSALPLSSPFLLGRKGMNESEEEGEGRPKGLLHFSNNACILRGTQ